MNCRLLQHETGKKEVDIGVIVLANHSNVWMCADHRAFSHHAHTVHCVIVVSNTDNHICAEKHKPCLPNAIYSPATDPCTNFITGMRSLVSSCTPKLVIQCHPNTFVRSQALSSPSVRAVAFQKFVSTIWRKRAHPRLNSLVYSTLRSCDITVTSNTYSTRVATYPMQTSATTMMGFFGPSEDPTFMRHPTYVLVNRINKSQTRYVQQCRCSTASKEHNVYYIDNDRVTPYRLIRMIRPPSHSAHALNFPRMDPEWYKIAHPDVGAHPHQMYYATGITNGHICHPDQITKYYPDAVCDLTTNGAYVCWRQQSYTLDEFVSNHMSLCALSTACLRESELISHPPTVSLPSVLVILTSANPAVCMRLLNEMSTLFLSGNADVCLVFNKSQSAADLHDTPIRHLRHYAAQAKFRLHIWPFEHNCGSDIPPFSVAVQRLRMNGTLDPYEWILKLHTKSNHKWRRSVTQGFVPFISKGLHHYLPIKWGGAACGLCPSDLFCRRYIETEFKITLRPGHHTFPAGSIFLMRKNLLFDILDDERVRETVRCAMIAGWYYDNTSCIENSPMHSVERLFGYLPTERSTPLYDITKESQDFFNSDLN